MAAIVSANALETGANSAFEGFVICAVGCLLSEIPITTQVSGEDVSLRRLRGLRLDPFCNKSNCSRGHIETLENDLRIALQEASPGKTPNLLALFDTTPESMGRNVDGLVRVAEKLTENPAGRRAEAMYVTTGSIEVMRKDLLVGTQSLRAVAMHACLSHALILHPDSDNCLTDSQVHKLLACAQCHQQLSSDPAWPLRPPVLVSLNLGSRCLLEALNVLTSNGVPATSVMFANIFLDGSSYRHETLVSLLNEGCHLIIDCLGHSSVFQVPDFDFPSDSQTLALLFEVFQRNPATSLKWAQHQITLANGDRGFKSQLISYGGSGLLPHVPLIYNSGIPFWECMLGRSLLVFLQWYKPPPPAEAAVEAQVKCFICENTFCISQDHYSKFGNEYCSAKCLALHRQRGWR